MIGLKKITITSFLLVILIIMAPSVTKGAVQDEINQRNQQIEELQRQIEQYQQQIDSSRGQANTLQNNINGLNAQINSIALTIRSLELSIRQTSSEVEETETQITDAEAKMSQHKEALAEYIKIIYESDQETLTELILRNKYLSDFFGYLNNLRLNQENLEEVIRGIKILNGQLEERQQQLEDKKNEYEKTRNLEALEKRSLDQNKASVSKLLKDTKGQEAKYQELVKKSKADIEALRAQIGYLAQNGVTAEDAVKFGNLAAIRAGIRPAFLIAELEQESALGSNVGKCYIIDTVSGATRRITNGQVYTKGIHPTRDLALFLQITAELGRDPFLTPISCGSSWGGAMGPAQFIPSTWMGYRAEVARLTGHSLPNPWNIEDAFVAAATKLSKDGASSKTRAGEIAASKRYYCGSAFSQKSSCVNYANSVQRLATEIEKNL